ncbi:MAG: hypothetical protein J5U17_03960 [Candidatus Methanoperedens sp.]|nr:hypothetical protein [Candidatus Methanoperedens sp.]MCE8428706.1 hypothetical protein [Candidatus Methanoperedens sp.]
MLEWLPRDPLNGIVISVTFFCSLIIGRYLKHRSGGKKIDPGVKFLLTFLLVISVTMMKHWYFPMILSAFCLIIASKEKILRYYSRNLIYPVIFSFFILAIQTVSTSSISYIIFAKVLASSSIMIFLVLTTPRYDILESMSRLRIPQTIIEISSFMERYVRTFSDEGKTRKAAAESRCGFRKNQSFLHKIKNLSFIGGILIISAFDRSDEVYRAMISRAWRPHIQDQYRLPLSMSDKVAGIILSSGIIGLSVIDRFL